MKLKKKHLLARWMPNSLAVLLVFLGLLVASQLRAEQRTLSNVTHQLVKAGFENVRVLDKKDTLLVTLETHHIRGTYRKLGEALRIMSQTDFQRKYYQLLVLENQQAQFTCLAQWNEGLWQVQVDYATEKAQKEFNNTQVLVVNSNTGKIDIYFQPIFEINNHRLDVLAYVGLYLAPSVETTLWKGNRFYLQPIIPVFNNFAKNNPDRHLQIGAVGMRQEWYNNDRIRFTTSLGTFLYNSLGLQANLRCHLTSRLDGELEAKYLHTQVLEGQQWHIHPQGHFSALAKLDYYHPATALQCKVSAGMFQFGDWGIRTDVVRHFGEHATGVYFTFAEGEWNAGFNFAIPITRKKRQFQSGKVRLHWPDFYSFEYSLVSSPNSKFEAQRMGENVKERPDQNFSAHYWQAAYLQHYLQRYLNKLIF